MLKEWNVSYANIAHRGGNKHPRIICDTCSKLPKRAQKRRRIFSL